MFEKVNSFGPNTQGTAAGRDGDRRVQDESRATGTAERTDASGRGGDALRAIDWGELTARLAAARDLRLLLRRDTQSSIEGAAASFGDAAARYFAALEDGERPVNPDDLEARKASRGIHPIHDGDAATGDAREN
ncbi:MAG: hypothetical protein RIC51_11580 [Erythrobacter sp.]|uniref:hypothetical protein n=1 Tax=Erythrobacter sp. TaxID=1042 RepID=UPI0032EFD905